MFHHFESFWSILVWKVGLLGMFHIGKYFGTNFVVFFLPSQICSVNVVNVGLVGGCSKNVSLCQVVLVNSVRWVILFYFPRSVQSIWSMLVW